MLVARSHQHYVFRTRKSKRNQSILVGEYLSKSNDCLVITIIVATTLFLIQGDLALPSRFIVGVDTGRSGISILRFIILIQSIAGETEEDIPRENNKPG